MALPTDRIVADWDITFASRVYPLVNALSAHFCVVGGVDRQPLERLAWPAYSGTRIANLAAAVIVKEGELHDHWGGGNSRHM